MEISSRHKRCDNCFFSVWAISPNRPALICKQKGDLPGRWQIVLLDQSCRSFYPSGVFKAGAKAVRRIPLTRGKFALVDARDYYRLVKFTWYASEPTKNTFYAARSRNGKKVTMHRVIMNPPGHLFVDHIDRNGLNNAKNNLRLCTPAQNRCNTFSSKVGTSKYKGVNWNKRIKKWGALIQLNRKIYQLGYFSNEIDAARAYDKKAKVLHGEFAYLNFPSAAQSRTK
jgi:hypothetical protein